MTFFDAVIAGVGELPPRRDRPGETMLGMITSASALALADARLEPGAVDGLFVGQHVGETPQHVPATVTEYTGLRTRVASIVDLGGASAAGMVWRAAAAISAGMCTTALCVLAGLREPVIRASNRNPIREFDVPFGASGANQAYAMIATRHMAEFGTTADQLASIAVIERTNAQQNPDAVFYGKPLTLEDVLSSAMIAEPLHLYEAVMPCAGAAALVVTSGARAHEFERPVTRLLGAGEYVTHRALSQAPSLTVSPLASAIADAYAAAGVAVTDIDVFSLYDCYTIMVGITLEDAGLCPKGQFGPFVEEHDFSSKGDVPLNPHGGQLGCGQADLAGGMSHIIEAVRQLRGDAGERQVPHPELALVTGNGATMSEACALVLRRGQ